MKNLKASLQRIYALCKKEFLAMMMDNGTRIVLIVPIIVQSFIFGYGADFTLQKVKIAIFNDTNCALARNLIEEIKGNETFKLEKNCLSLSCLEGQINNQKAMIGIYFPSNFDKNKEMLAILDARNTASANTALSYLHEIVNNFNNKFFKNPSLEINSRLLYNQNNYTIYTMMVGMILTLSMIQVMILAGFSVAREREEGSFDMMLMTPTNSVEIFVGKAMMPILVAIFQALFLTAICYYYFDIPIRGRVFDLFVLICVFSICNVGIGLGISTICKTSFQAVVYCFLIIMPVVIISGLITPVDAMPSWFRFFAYIDPLYYANNAIWRIYLEGQSLKDVYHLLIPMILIGFFFIIMAIRLFRKTLD